MDIGVMQGGDYMIHLFIENCKNLIPDGAAAEVFDAIVEIDCLGSKQYSSVMSDTMVDSNTTTYLGEHFFFEPRGLS